MANRILSFVWIVVLAVGVDGVPTTTSSTTTSSTACPTVMQDRNPRLPQFHCNKPGYTTDHSFLISFVTYNGYKPCYDACLADSRCISFAYGDGSVDDEVSFQSTCMTFATTIDAKNFTAQAGSPTSYWNLKGCFNIPSGCSTSGVTSTTTIAFSVTPPTTTYPSATCVTSTAATPVNYVKNPSFEILDSETQGPVNWTLVGQLLFGRGYMSKISIDMAGSNSKRFRSTTVLAQNITGLNPQRKYAISYYYVPGSFTSEEEGAQPEGNCFLVTSFDNTDLDSLSIKAARGRPNSTSFQIQKTPSFLPSAESGVLQLTWSCQALKLDGYGVYGSFTVDKVSMIPVTCT